MLFGISFSYLFRQDDNFNYMFLCMFSNLVLFSNCYFGIQYDKYIVPYQFTKLLVKSNVLFRFFFSGVRVVHLFCFRCCIVFCGLFLLFFGGVQFAHLFSFVCCVVFLCFVCLRPVSSVPNVASVSGLCSPCVVCT